MSLSPKDITAATKVLEQHTRILVIPHANVDPDGLSSALACYSLFGAMGKEVTVICPDALPSALEFLPGFSKLEQDIQERQDFVITVNLDDGVEVDKLRYTVEDKKVNIIVVPRKGHIRPQQIALAEGEQRYDLVVVVDTADLALLGSFYTSHIDLFSSVPVLNIDHHISNTRFGQLQLIDPTAASATEVLYAWCMQVPELRAKLTPDIATLLLTGIITDTRSFQNPNTTPRSLEVAAELLELGARQQEIIQHIYKTKPLSTLKIWGRALNRIQVDPVARIVWSTVSKEDLAEMEATSRETHGILDELISTIPDADVYVLFTEVEGGGIKASLRSSAAVDASLLSGQLFSGGGHARAAGFRIQTYSNFQLQVLECIRMLKAGMQQLCAQEEQLPATPVPQVKSQEFPVPLQAPGNPSRGQERDIVQDLTKREEKK
jgi:nanoRNase/pAp phosphatase (c-di-AMP/oligoRNAs hydrolase)